MEHSAPRKKNWFRRHKLITAFVIILILGVGYEAIAAQNSADNPVTPQSNSSTTSGSSSTSNTNSTSSGTSSGTSSSPSATIPASEGGSSSSGSSSSVPAYRMTISNSQANVTASGGTVTGQITNNEDQIHSATIQATFYDAKGNVIGKATGSSPDVAPQATKSFTLTTTQNVAGYDKMVVEVSTIS